LALLISPVTVPLSDLSPDGHGPFRARPAQIRSVEGLPGGFLNRVYYQHEVRIERALYLLPGLAGAVGGLIGANRADVPADGFDVLVDVVALDPLDGLRHLGKEPEQSASNGGFPAALSVHRAIRANPANPVSDNRF
jgi:hypothetical protein